MSCRDVAKDVVGFYYQGACLSIMASLRAYYCWLADKAVEKLVVATTCVSADSVTSIRVLPRSAIRKLQYRGVPSSWYCISNMVIEVLFTCCQLLLLLPFHVQYASQPVPLLLPAVRPDTIDESAVQRPTRSDLPPPPPRNDPHPTPVPAVP